MLIGSVVRVCMCLQIALYVACGPAKVKVDDLAVRLNLLHRR